MANRQLDIHLNEGELLGKIGDAFSSPVRRKIIALLCEKSRSISELTSILDIAPSTMTFHIKILLEAKLIRLIPAPNKKGNEKNVSIGVEYITIWFNQTTKDEKLEYIEEIPIGGYSRFEVNSPCMIVDEFAPLDPVDSPVTFNSPQRANATRISFINGFLEYDLLTAKYKKKPIVSLSFSLELCSECPNYNNNWKSDISFWINGTKVGAFRSLGDYGGRKGRFSPDWWPRSTSNYGVMVRVSVREDGTYINDEKKSEFKISDIDFKSSDILKFRLGVEPNSHYPGGINIFGKGGGDYNQGIVETVEYLNS